MVCNLERRFRYLAPLKFVSSSRYTVEVIMAITPKAYLKSVFTTPYKLYSDSHLYRIGSIKSYLIGLHINFFLIAENNILLRFHLAGVHGSNN